MSEQTTLPAVAAHGARRLPSVDVDSYNVELKDSEGFIGDRASKGAFRNMIDRIHFTTDVDVAWHPSWLGTKQTRYFKIEGDMLSIITPPGQHPKYPGRTVRGVLTWKRE